MKTGKPGCAGLALCLCVSLTAVSLFAAQPPQEEDRQRNVDGIRDNSFLVEEAYNQEPDTVQHIFNALYGWNRQPGSDDESWLMAFTQEWPVFSQAHQFSYTVPYAYAESGGASENGLGDMLVNYRYQAYFNEESLTAFAPRLSLVLPTGDEDMGFGFGTVGYQLNLPFSTALSDKWYVHANAGFTFWPSAGSGPERDLNSYNFGASAIYAATRNWHLMLEWFATYQQEIEFDGVREREFMVLLAPGVRKAFNFGNTTQLVLGAAAPIGLSGNAPDFGAFLYVSFEHLFRKR
jgi:hypothetical protein